MEEGIYLCDVCDKVSSVESYDYMKCKGGRICCYPDVTDDLSKLPKPIDFYIISHKKIEDGHDVKRMTQKKYASRPSPPFPAQEREGWIVRGNDRNLYRSIPNVKGVCAWKKV